MWLNSKQNVRWNFKNNNFKNVQLNTIVLLCWTNKGKEITKFALVFCCTNHAQYSVPLWKKKEKLKNEALIAFTATQLNLSPQKKRQALKKAHSSYSTAPSSTINLKVCLTVTKAIKSAALNTCWSSSKQNKLLNLHSYRTLANKFTQRHSCSPVVFLGWQAVFL